jgi:peptide/nickel transport system ATP-binding protein
VSDELPGLAHRPVEATLWLSEGSLEPRRGQWRRMARDWAALAGAGIVVALVVIAIFSPLLVLSNPLAINTTHILQGPSIAHPFGTDNLGRDIASRVIAGTRVSMSLAGLAGVSIVTIGVLLGALAGYLGGWLDAVVMRVADVVLAFPSLILVLAIAGALGAGYWSLVIALVFTWWPSYARLVRAGVLVERERDYVDASRGLGARPRRLIFRHIMPNVIPPVVVLLSFDLGFIILAVAALGYLGVGVAPPTPEWGTMISDGKDYVLSSPQMVVFPGLAIATAVVGFNLLGEGLRNALDPRHVLARRSSLRRFSPSRSARSRSMPHLEPVTEAWAGSRVKRTPARREHVSPNALTPDTATILSVANLRTVIQRERGETAALEGVSLTLVEGETLGIVGESGCGKTLTALSIMGLLPPGIRIVAGALNFAGNDLVTASQIELRSLRGSEMAMVFQNPMTSLDPTMTVGDQIAEPVRVHRRATRSEALERAAEVLGLVGMPRPNERLHDYPHQLSGGMRQRVIIAMALACEPKLLIADEPTTALDVTIQAQILDLLDELKARLGMSMILITHDMGVIAGHTDRVMVMYAGQIVESASTSDLFASPRHPYTEALLGSIPRLDADRRSLLRTIPGIAPDLAELGPGCRFEPRCSYASGRCRDETPRLEARPNAHAFSCFHPLLQVVEQGSPGITGGRLGPARSARLERASEPGSEGSVDSAARAPAVPILVVQGVVKEFRSGRRSRNLVNAVSGASLDISAGETFGLVGESGCGKTTLGRIIAALERPDGGSVRFGGVEVTSLSDSALRSFRREVQMVFQDPQASLDPRVRILDSLREPLVIHGQGGAAEQAERVAQLLREVGLAEHHGTRYPHQLSGGERQRIGLARALMLSPRLVVADEPVSSLDVSARSQVLNLMRRLQQTHGLTYLLISHDLAAVGYLANRIGVMYLGKLVEVGTREEVFGQPAHPYTAGLLAAIPQMPRPTQRASTKELILGELPPALVPPSGCRFRGRCPRAQVACAEQEPPLRHVRPASDDVSGRSGGGHSVACHFPLAKDLD